jgi:hypothetical protein
MKVRIECPAKVSLFVYDNGTFIVESFLPEEVKVKIVMDKSIGKLNDLLSGEELTGTTMQGSQIWGREKADDTSFDIMLKPHSYRVFLTR